MPRSMTSDLLKQVRSLIINARQAAGRSVDLIQVWTNFQIGMAIVKHKQEGKARAQYAASTLKSISRRLTKEFGRGFTERNLELMRKFYLTYHDRISKSLISKSLESVPHSRKSKSLISKSQVLKKLKQLVS